MECKVCFCIPPGGYSQLLCADEKLEWSRELLDSEPQLLYTNSRARNGRRSDDYQHDLSIRIMWRFTRKTRG